MENRRVVSVACFAAFVVMGITTSVLGPTLQSLAPWLGLPLENAGILRAAQQIGMIVATLAAGRLLDFRSPRDVMLPGVLMTAVGLVGLIVSHSLVIGLMASVVTGVGVAFINVGANVAIGALYEDNAASPLAALHTFYGVGLFVGPLIADLAQTTTNDWRTVYVIGTLLCAGLGIVFARLSIDIHRRPAQSALEPPQAPRPPIAWLPLLPPLLLIFLYNGAGSGMSDWLPTHLQLAAHAGTTAADQITSLYGLALTTGRAISIGTLRRFGNLRVLTAAVGVATLGAALIFFGGAQIGLVAAGVVMVGIGFAPIYPTVIAIGGQLQPENRGSVVGILAGLASIGGIIIPFLQGKVGNGQSGGMVVIFIATLIMIVSLFFLFTSSRKAVRAR